MRRFINFGCVVAPEHSPLGQVRTAQAGALGPPPQRLTDQLVVYRQGIHFDSSALGGEGSSVEHHAISSVGRSPDLYNRAALQLDVKFRLVRTGDERGLEGVDARTSIAIGIRGGPFDGDFQTFVRLLLKRR